MLRKYTQDFLWIIIIFERRVRALLPIFLLALSYITYVFRLPTYKEIFKHSLAKYYAYRYTNTVLQYAYLLS